MIGRNLGVSRATLYRYLADEAGCPVRVRSAPRAGALVAMVGGGSFG